MEPTAYCSFTVSEDDHSGETSGDQTAGSAEFDRGIGFTSPGLVGLEAGRDSLKNVSQQAAKPPRTPKENRFRVHTCKPKSHRRDRRQTDARPNKNNIAPVSESQSVRSRCDSG